MLLVILTSHSIMLINFYKLCSCKVHHSNHYHSSNKSFDLCLLCVIPTSWAVTSQGRTLLWSWLMNHLLWVLSYRCSQREGHLHLRALPLCSASGYMVFLQESYLCCGDSLELQVSALLQTVCRCEVLLAMEALRLLSVCNADTGNASRVSSPCFWMRLCCGLQIEVVSSGDQWPRETRADQASESSSCGDSLPVGVDGGSANGKPGNTLLYVF